MIVRRYRQPVLNYIGRMVHERELALDLSQDVFVKAYAALRSYRPQYKFGPGCSGSPRTRSSTTGGKRSWRPYRWTNRWTRIAPT